MHHIFCGKQHYTTNVVNKAELVLNLEHCVLSVPESDNARIGHGIRETQDATPHDSIHHIKGRGHEGRTSNLNIL